jgi:hypothetical protein
MSHYFYISLLLQIKLFFANNCYPNRLKPISPFLIPVNTALCEAFLVSCFTAFQPLFYLLSLFLHFLMNFGLSKILTASKNCLSFIHTESFVEILPFLNNLSHFSESPCLFFLKLIVSKSFYIFFGAILPTSDGLRGLRIYLVFIYLLVSFFSSTDV